RAEHPVERHGLEGDVEHQCLIAAELISGRHDFLEWLRPALDVLADVEVALGGEAHRRRHVARSAASASSTALTESPAEAAAWLRVRRPPQQVSMPSSRRIYAARGDCRTASSTVAPDPMTRLVDGGASTAFPCPHPHVHVSLIVAPPLCQAYGRPQLCP